MRRQRDVPRSGNTLRNGVRRIGSVAGTFLLPVTLAAWGVTPALLMLAGVLVVGMVVSIAIAPETAHRSLDDEES